MRLADEFDDGGAEPIHQLAIAPLGNRRKERLAVDAYFLASLAIKLRLCRERCPRSLGASENQHVVQPKADRQLDSRKPAQRALNARREREKSHARPFGSAGPTTRVCGIKTNSRLPDT
jgi:hypothetical protein